MSNTEKVVFYILFIFLIVLNLTNRCSTPTEIYSIDTVYKETTYIFMKDTNKVEPIIPKPTYVFNNYSDSSFVKRLLDSLLLSKQPFCDTFQKIYPITYDDSLINFSQTILLRGNLDSANFKYFIKPQTITYPVITKTIVPKGVYLGGEIFYHPQLDGLDIQIKGLYLNNKYIYSAGYSPFSNTVNLGVGRKIF